MTVSPTYPFNPRTSTPYHVKPARVLDDSIVSVASWEYPVDFSILESKDPSKGNLIILGRPWLATANAFIGCRDG